MTPASRQYKDTTGTFVDGPGTVCFGTDVELKAIPDLAAATFPTGSPVWTVDSKPTGAAVAEADLADGSADVTVAAAKLDKAGDYTFKAECGTSSASITITIIKVELDHDLWWFNGENPGGGYHITSTLTATPVTTGTFKWDVTTGVSRIDLNNGGTDADSITATDDNTVTVKSTDASAGAASVTEDVAITLTYNGTTVCSYALAVFSPDHLIHLGNEDFPNGTSFRSVITYEIRDQFNQKLPHNVPWNEDIDGDGAASNGAIVAAAAISDWTIANGRPEDENWGWGAEAGWVVDPGDAFDTIIQGAPATRVPTPQNGILSKVDGPAKRN